MKKDLRVLYAAGPGNVIGTYHHWAVGRDDPSQVSITYSSQFYDVCKELSILGYVISSCKDKKIIRDDRFIIEHCPKLRDSTSGIMYHLIYLLYGLRLTIAAIWFKADAIVIADGTSHWFIFSLLNWLGVSVIPSLHCVLWAKYGSQTSLQNMLLKLDAILFRRSCSVILAVSNDISNQVKEITCSQHQPIVQFLPTYRRADFEKISPPSDSRLPFIVMFAGRIEANKGIFDILKIAKRFITSGERGIEFEICGSGSMLEQLRDEVQEADIASYFHCHGHCSKHQMHEIFSRSHIVVVPTRTDFVEGFNKVVVEGVLSGRPDRTSSVCPALHYLRKAVIEVPPEDIEAYGNAILKLRDDPSFYEEKRKKYLSLQEQLYDPLNGWGSALKLILISIDKEKKTLA